VFGLGGFVGFKELITDGPKRSETMINIIIKAKRLALGLLFTVNVCLPMARIPCFCFMFYEFQIPIYHNAILPLSIIYQPRNIA
jgi:hypothetical protein